MEQPSKENPRVFDLPRERPRYVHVAIGATIIVSFVYPLYQILEEPMFVSIMIFNLLSLLLTFPLKGPLWCKIILLGLGNIVGLAWNIVRLSLVVVTAGVCAFEVVHSVIGPAIDFVWMIPVWSLGLSALASAGRQKAEGK